MPLPALRRRPSRLAPHPPASAPPPARLTTRLTACLTGLTVAVALLASCNSPAAGAEFDREKLQAIRPRLEAFVQEQELAGAVALVGSSAGAALVEPVGLLDREAGRPMQRDTLFRIASMTKPITALAVMQLVDEGRLSVDDPVEKHLPIFQGQRLVASRSNAEERLVKPTRPITVRDLLTHTSGLPGGFPPGVADLYAKRQLTLAEAVCLSSQRPLEFEPGSRWAYCNAGIDTLGRLVETLSGKPFEQYVEERICRPLGMVDTAFYPSETQLARAAVVYDRRDGKLTRAVDLLVGPSVGAKHPIPAGGLYSTAPDLARLYQALLRGGELEGRRVVSAASLREMTRVQTGDLPCGFVPGMSFGYGFAVVQAPQGVTGMLSAGTYGHGGVFGTQAWIDPHRDCFIVLLFQRTGLQNGDGTEMRKEVQRLAMEALARD